MNDRSYIFIHLIYYYQYTVLAFIYLIMFKGDVVYLYSRNYCILAIYYDQNIYDFIHTINSFTIIIPTRSVTWMSAIYEIYNNYYYIMKKNEMKYITSFKINIF